MFTPISLEFFLRKKTNLQLKTIKNYINSFKKYFAYVQIDSDYFLKKISNVKSKSDRTFLSEIYKIVTGKKIQRKKFSFKKNTKLKRKVKEKFIDFEKNLENLFIFYKRNLDEIEFVKKAIIFFFYYFYPPLRAEFKDMKIKTYNFNDSENYISLKKNEIVLNKFKTKKTYKQIVIPLNRENYIEYLLKKIYNFEGKIDEFFLSFYYRKNFSSYNKFLKEVFMKDYVTTNFLRSFFITRNINLITNGLDVEKLLKNSFLSGHTFQTEIENYYVDSVFTSKKKLED